MAALAVFLPAEAFAETNHIGAMANNLLNAVSSIPGFVAACSYLGGLVLAIMAIIKLKDHIEDPRQPLREAVVRFLIGGMLFALPIVFAAMRNTIDPNNTGIDPGGLTGFLNDIGDFFSDLFGDGLGTFMDEAMGVGGVLTNISMALKPLTGFLIGIAYIFGVVIGVTGIVKLKEHLLDPKQVQVFEPIKRFLAAGCFFALPAVISATRDTLNGGGGFSDFLLILIGLRGFSLGAGGEGLDGVFLGAISNIYTPMIMLIRIFSFLAGAALVMVGISRLLKTAQDGARGPSGIGTIMTFVAASALLSIGSMISSLTTTMFGWDDNLDFGTLAFSTGEAAVDVHLQNVYKGVVAFMTMVGMLSVVKGFFVLRASAEGNSQASIMAGVTHLVGGAIAVNLGALVKAVQSTLGLSVLS
ncbi:MAG: hypothetical protein GC136_03300 [Alphaproteobacteria bacterium]|nr:hypothetical protein [Alphaproteobacteria bacterium]